MFATYILCTDRKHIYVFIYVFIYVIYEVLVYGTSFNQIMESRSERENIVCLVAYLYIFQ